MLYLAIDHHKCHLQVCVLDDAGTCVHQSRVSTRPPEVDRFLSKIDAESADQGGFVVMVEECGFTLWLEEKLAGYAGCQRVVKIQPLRRLAQKTDKRDAAAIGELFWVNRARILNDEPLLQVRRVHSPTEEDRQARVLISERTSLEKDRKRAICQIKDILRRFNVWHACPTKGLFTKAGRRWLEQVELPRQDRRRIDRILARLDLLAKQLREMTKEIEEQAEAHPMAQVIRTMTGAAALTSLGLACRIGPIDRFRRPDSLANFFGLAPSINDSGETVGRHGSITKRGNATARFLLGQMVYHVMRKDRDLRQWYVKIRKRRGRKIALVAAMRRLACIIWHMLKTGESYDSIRSQST